MTGPLTPQIGDKIPIGSFLANVNCFGEVSDLDTPDQTSFSIEGFGPNAALVVSGFMGPQGVPGTNAPTPKLQDQIFDSSDDLPTDLTDDDVDIGKYWIVREFDESDPPNQIGSWFYIWMGTQYEQFRMGSPGEAGPVPVITPSVLLLDPDDDDLESDVVVTGDNYHPSWRLNLKAPRGPVGPATNIGEAPDVDVTTPPDIGQALVWDGTKWKPESLGTIVTKFWTMPEAAFTSIPLAIGTRIPVASFTVPALDYDCVPVVFGHLRVTGLELDSSPFIVGAEVRLGDPNTGTLVARGFGNISTYTHIIPHASTSATPNDAITPGNGRGVIPAGSTGAPATLYINLFNDGLEGIYNFDSNGAQISIQAIPVN